MKILNKSILLLCIFIFAFPFVSNAAAKTTTASINIRLNQYYVLYTTPTSPYIDNGRLYLPLRSVSELLGAQVGYVSDSKTADISFKLNKLVINMLTQKIAYNGKVIDTELKPQIRQQSIYVPVQILIEGLGLNGKWDQQTKILNIQEESVKNLELFQLASEFDKVSIISEDTFLPLSFTLETGASNGHNKMKLSVKAKNISGHAIPEGQEDLHPTYFISSGVTLETLDRKRPAIKKDEIFTRQWERTMNQSLQYILIEGRTIQ
ncbi:stalk domain-containing protein [Paenibacillus monticola]|uniref:stalk domain-containing protein n=1 Tax=Paenibacillus monticola TaxID=2666075 RepID=UPI0012AC9B80